MLGVKAARPALIDEILVGSQPPVRRLLMRYWLEASRRAALIRAYTCFRLAEYTKVPEQPGGKG
jgi:hypothetical protein